jgi:hypothetical protein
MRTNSLTARIRDIRTSTLFLLALAVCLTGFAAMASQSKATPVSLTFDNGRASFGFLSDRTVLPADSQFPSPDLPAPQRTDIQLNGDLADGQITIPAATNTGVQFPYMHVMHPLEPDLKIPFTFRLNSDGLTGTWDEATGAMTLEGKLDVIVITGQGSSFPLPDSLDDVAVPPLGLFARCRFDDVPVKFSTATKSPFTGQAFKDGFGVNGAMTTAWDSLTPSVSENGGECGDLNQITTSSGGLWLSNGVVEPVPQPGDPDPTCETDLSLCPTPKYVEIDAVRLKPGRKVVRAGQKLILRVKVHNSGNKAAKNLKVKIKTTNKAFKAPKFVKLTVPAGKHASKKFKVKVKRNAKGRARITAASKGWSGHSYLKVKPAG